MILKQENYIYRLQKYYEAFSLYYNGFNNLKKIDALKKEKIAVIKISNPKTFGRYFYIFIKFLSLEGYTIYVPGVNFKTFRKRFFMREAKARIYFNLIFEERLVNFNEPPLESKSLLVFEEDSISFDYFSPFFDSTSLLKFFPIPMSMHPLFYHKDLWDQPYDNTDRKTNSVFMIGNFDEQYSQFKEQLFRMESRLTNISFLKKKGVVSEFRSKKQFYDFLDSTRDKECIILDRNNFSIEMENLRNVLSQFSFFLALPGVNIPHCHNIVEAMSVGSIPIMHENYAALWHPDLKHLQTAILYSNPDDLYDKLKFVFDLEENEVKRMRLNVLKYYNNNLTPAAVIKNLENNINSLILLQAEHYSVACIKSNISF